jgi:hypothetical protein
VDRATFFKLLKSLIIVFLVSGTFSYFLTFLGANFIAAFLSITALQFLFFYFYGEFVTSQNVKLLLRTEVDIAKEKSKQVTQVICPCDRKIASTVPVNINTSNSYKCPGCDKQISIFVETKTALATQPILTDPLTAPIVLDQIKNLNEI